jgi:hypothetical protein
VIQQTSKGRRAVPFPIPADRCSSQSAVYQNNYTSESEGNQAQYQRKVRDKKFLGLWWSPEGAKVRATHIQINSSREGVALVPIQSLHPLGMKSTDPLLPDSCKATVILPQLPCRQLRIVRLEWVSLHRECKSAFSPGRTVPCSKDLLLLVQLSVLPNYCGHSWQQDVLLLARCNLVIFPLRCDG